MADSSHFDANINTSTDSTGAGVVSVVQSNVTESTRVDSVLATGGRGIPGPKGNPGDNAPSDHTLLTSVGINTHSQIDAALTRLVDTSGTNTGDQDLSPYATSSSLTAGLATKANTSHTHTAAQITDLETTVSANTDVAANTAARHTHSNKAVLDATTASYTTAEQTKLSGVAAGAEVNVNPDWNASSGDAQILNKPTLGTAAAKNVPSSGNASSTEVVKGDDTRLTDARVPTAHSHTISDISASGTPSASTYLRGDGAWATPAGGEGSGATISQIIIDFGAINKSDEVFTITDALISASSKITASVAWTNTLGRDPDEIMSDPISLSVEPLSGTMNIYASAIEGTVSGKYAINYLIG